MNGTENTRALTPLVATSVPATKQKDRGCLSSEELVTCEKCGENNIFDIERCAAENMKGPSKVLKLLSDMFRYHYPMAEINSRDGKY